MGNRQRDERRGVTPPRPQSRCPASTPAPTGLLALQRIAGNNAVAHLVEQSQGCGSAFHEALGRHAGSLGAALGQGRQGAPDGRRMRDERLSGEIAAAVSTGKRGSGDHTSNRVPSGSAPHGTPVQRAGSGWRVGAVKNAHDAVRQERPNDPFVHSLHHIIPKSLIGSFVELLSEEQALQVVTDLEPHMSSVVPRDASSRREPKTLLRSVLRNVPANLVLGPASHVRKDDPKQDAPDYNYDDEGSMTPRTQRLERVYEFMSGKVASRGPVDDEELRNEFTALVVEASVIHDPAGSGEVLLDPGRATWLGDPDKRNVRRRRRRKAAPEAAGPSA